MVSETRIDAVDLVDRAGDPWAVELKRLDSDDLPPVWVADFFNGRDEDAETAESFCETFTDEGAARKYVARWTAAHGREPLDEA